MTVSGTGTVNASNAGLTAITFNSTFNMSSGTPTWTIKSGTTYTFKYGVTITVGTIDTSNLNAVFAEASDATLDVDSSATFNNVEINKPGAWGFSTNDTINVAGTLTLTSGSFQGSGKLVTVNGSAGENFRGGGAKVEMTAGTFTVATYATNLPYMKVNGELLPASLQEPPLLIS
ncbi:MAG: hypothetical protein IPJ69_15055 [Deltaproteobacteria bacterium]|nr:MAG: hypothetical protein IPJ69_15055 [Deltaproteobacteria bacterium]